MNSCSPGEKALSLEEQPEKLPHHSRVITVVSREGSPPPESWPFARPQGTLSRHHARVLKKHSRSRSATDMQAGRKKSPGLYHHWKEDSKVLPSCQSSLRRSPLSASSSRSTTPDLVRKNSESTVIRHSLDLERSLSLDEMESVKTHKRNKSDSGIVPDECIPRLSFSGNSDSWKFNLPHDGHTDDSNKKDQSISKNRSLPKPDATDSHKMSSDIPFSTRQRLRNRRQRNHSESELSFSSSEFLDGEDSVYSLSTDSKHFPEHRSLESLFGTSSTNVFPDFLPSSLGAPEVDLESQDWGPALRSSSRTDSMEHLNYAGNRSRAGSVDDDNDDHLNVSWSSTGWRKSVKSRSSCSSDDSSEDVFFSTDDSVGKVTAEFERYLNSRMQDQESESEVLPEKLYDTKTCTKNEKGPKQLEKDKNGKPDLQEHPLTSSESSSINVQSSNIPSVTHSKHGYVQNIESDTNCKDETTGTSHDVTHSRERPSVKSDSDEHPEVYEPSRPSSVLLPHLQRTLEAVRQHIKSKKTSTPSSKIPVRVRHQVSPRRHSNQSSSENQSRRSSTSSAKSNSSGKESTASSVSCNSPQMWGSLPSLVETARSSDGSTVDAKQQSKGLLSTALTLETSKPLKSCAKASKVTVNKDGWTGGLTDSACVNDDKVSVCSPSSPRIQVTDTETCQSIGDADESGSPHIKTDFVCNTYSDNMQNRSDPLLRTGNSSPSRLEIPSGEQNLSLPKDKNEGLPPKSKTNENLPRKDKRKTTSRVDYLLNNDLFRKHLSGHIDLVERNILRVKKLGLKKSFSNLDLTATDTQRLQAAFHSTLKLQDIELDGSFGDESENSETSSKNTGVDSASSNPSKVATQSVQSTVSNPPETPRRRSLACDDPSLQQLQEVLRQGKPFPGTVFSAARRGRIHIPSFNEFRSQRQRGGVSAARVLHAFSDDSHGSEESAGDVDSVTMNYRPLDTITEDDALDTAKPAVSMECEASIAEEMIENDRDEVDKGTVAVNSQAKQVLQQGTLDRKACADNSKQNANRHSTKGRSRQLSVTAKNESKAISTKRTSNQTKSNKNVKNKPPTDQRKKTKVTTSQPCQQAVKSSKVADNISRTRTPEAAGDSDKSVEVQEDGGDERPSNHSSGSSDATVLEEFSDGEIMLDDGNSDEELSRSGFEKEFPYLLFDDAAVSMDTESWARLFSQTHKPRRKERSKSKSHRGDDSLTDKPPTVPVLRSSSDVTGQTTNGGQGRQRKRRLRKERPYKSDPLADGSASRAYSDSRNVGSGAGTGPQGEAGVMRFLEEGRISGDSHASSFPSLEELTEESSSEDSEPETDDEARSRKRLSNLSSTSDDSGVMGQEVSSPDPPLGPLPPRQDATTSPSQIMSCFHCNPGELEPSVETEKRLLCDKCLQRQQERKETIYEIIETEISYGRDLRILKEEFYVPMQTTGLLTEEQLDTVFINLDDLITINTQLTEKLRAALHNAAKTCDQALNSVNIGSLFIESSTMFLAFENYCVNQATASASLEQLERERELLRIFLQVSQTENGLLRRMHLKSFLMVPVQRIMKYPLLLNRLYKATPNHHSDKEDIRQAREKIEDILGHINAKAKGIGGMRIKRKQSELRRYSLTEKIEVNRVALEVLGWSKKEVSDLITSRMWYAQPADHAWAAKRCRNIKFTPIHAVLLTLGQKRNDNVALGQQAAVVLVREKNGKYQAVRDPFLLEKSVVTVDPDCDDVFELQEWGREAYIFKAEEPRETLTWVQHLRQQTHNLGQWRRRRNALPNIMLKNI